MRIGYCVSVDPRLASFRLRVLLPSRFVGPHIIGGVGDVTFFYKAGNPDIARRLKGPIVYDVVNAHFHDPSYREMVERASVITCSSFPMVRVIREHTGREAIAIPDPYENGLSEPAVQGDRVVWFGHQANLKSLAPYADLDPDLCTADVWSPGNEAKALESAGVVLLTGNNPGASCNRPVKAIRAGRFVVAPGDCPEAWGELSEFMWIGDVREGIRWAFANREEACRKVQWGQKYVERFSPKVIGEKWKSLFASTLGQDTSTSRDGPALTSR